jgi:hypothetical protein
VVSDGSCEITELNVGLKRNFSFSHIRENFHFYPIFAKKYGANPLCIFTKKIRKKKRTKICA